MNINHQNQLDAISLATRIRRDNPAEYVGIDPLDKTAARNEALTMVTFALTELLDDSGWEIERVLNFLKWATEALETYHYAKREQDSYMEIMEAYLDEEAHIVSGAITA